VRRRRLFTPDYPHTLWALRPPRFVIAQTGHSGSGYASRVLTQAGIRTGHEDWFRPYRRRVRGLVGDSSWCSVAHLDGYRGVVFHQVRHPLKVVRSLTHMVENGEYAKLRARILGGLSGDSVVDAMRSYVVMNEAIEPRAAARWRVEDFDLDDVRRVAAAVGEPFDETAAAAALSDTPKDVNRHHEDGHWSWDDLPEGDLRDRVMDLADRYGYPVG
jgi:hypothetical protein